MESLFYDKDNRVISVADLHNALMEIGAEDCNTLFIHSDIMFGRPVGKFKRKEYLASLSAIFHSINVKNIVAPTFTYSFCNKENYDIVKSKTSMGALNEYIRQEKNRYRTDDPLLSLSVPEEIASEFQSLSNHSLGEDSGLDRIHHLDGVQFLFFGAEMAECFTYVHYVEKMMNVSYRFDMPFEGEIIYPDGRIIHREQFIHTQCYGVKLPQKYKHFEQDMEDKGYLRKKRLGDKYVACISESDAYREIREHIRHDKYYFVEEPYVESELIQKYTYNTEQGRITHC